MRTHIRKCKQELKCLTTENPNNYCGFLKNLKRISAQDEVDIDLSDFYFLKQSTPPQGQIDSSLSCQAGFKRNSRTIDNIFILQSLVVSQKAHKKPLYACYIDFTKAFDYVNRHALVVDGKFLSVIQSMFYKSNGRVKWRNKFSKPIKSKYGVLKGGVLSPKLFTEFLCDISEYLDRSLGL